MDAIGIRIPADELSFVDSTSAAVTTSLHVETPENVVLDYQLAGPAVRCLAYLVDFLVRVGLFAVVAIFLNFAAALWSRGFSFGVLLIILFIVDWLYYVFCEWKFRGKSVGKHAMGIRVIQAKGYPITFFSSCLRNVIRAVDSMPFLLHGVGFLTILITKKGQRLGDLAAGTVVITERPVRLPKEPIILEKIQPLPRNELMGSFVPSQRTLAVVEEFLGRRFILSHERGHVLAAVLASSLAERLNFQGDAKLVEQYPMAFLARVYVTFVQRVEDEEEDLLSGMDSMIGQSSVNLGRF